MDINYEVCECGNERPGDLLLSPKDRYNGRQPQLLRLLAVRGLGRARQHIGGTRSVEWLKGIPIMSIQSILPSV